MLVEIIAGCVTGVSILLMAFEPQLTNAINANKRKNAKLLESKKYTVLPSNI